MIVVVCSKLCAQRASSETQAGFDKPVSFPGQKGNNENEAVYSTLILMYPENFRRRSFALPNLQGDTIAEQHLLFAILMFTVGSHQEEPFWNRIPQWLILVVQYTCALAAVCNIAMSMATSEGKPEMKMDYLPSVQ